VSVAGPFNAVIDTGVLNLFLWLGSTREVSLLLLYNLVAPVLANLNSYLWISVTVASTGCFCSVRYVVFSRRRWLRDRL
jgi:hypothetical protein